MKLLLKNYSEFKKKLNTNSQKIDIKDYPFFCMIVGYLFTKIENFDQLYKSLEQAFQLVSKDKLPENQFFQWLMFLYDNPYRFEDCQAFIQNINSDQKIDVIDEIQTLFSSDRYIKKPLASQNQYKSIDTVVLDCQKIQENHLENFLDSNFNQANKDIDQLNKMQEDQKMARMLQQQEENYARSYKQKMKSEQTMCQICYVDLYEGDPSFLDKCGHGFHQNCLVESFKAQIFDNNFPLKCPNQQCKLQCLEADIKMILSEDLYTKYQDHTLKAYADMHGDSVSWCPTADCGYMFFFQKDDDVRFQCLQCKKQYCLNCRCEWHKDMTCAQYKVSSTVSQQDLKFLDFVKGKKFKQCPKCKFWVQKNEGCDHMTCKCKFEFCYKCGGIYMKCQCFEKARQQQERRRQALEEKRRKRMQKQLKMQSKQKDINGESPRRGRSKRGSKK